MPRVMWEYTSSQVLTMEYTPGVKINRSECWSSFLFLSFVLSSAGAHHGVHARREDQQE